MLSVTIITLNEERNIERALKSVRGLTDDIVVVDSGSADRTVEICRENGARVIEREWEGYSGTKNFANSQAVHPWILSLDADEALSDTLRNSILDHFSPDLPQNHVFSCNRLANYCGKWILHSGWYPDRKIRIWHRDFGQWEGSIHEKIAFRGTPAVRHLEGDLLHYSYHTVEEHRRKGEKYAQLMAESLFQQGRRCGYAKRIIAPAVRFLRDFILKGGFRDGGPGLTICLQSARSVRIKYSRLRELHATARR